jgi:hypothetical protein
VQEELLGSEAGMGTKVHMESVWSVFEVPRIMRQALFRQSKAVGKIVPLENVSTLPYVPKPRDPGTSDTFAANS